MSAVLVLTPIVIASWPAITAAVLGAASAMGYTVLDASVPQARRRTSVETELEESEVVAEGLTPGEKLVVQRDDVTIEIGLDDRGRCTVCASGEGRSPNELRKIADDIAGRITQQFVYNKLLTELKQRDYAVVDEERLADESVRLRVRVS